MQGQVLDVIDYGIILDQSTEEEVTCEEPEKEKPSPEFFDPYNPLIKDFRLSVGDRLEIGIVDELEAYHENVVVAPDGCLYYAFVDGLYVVGKNLSIVKQELETLLSRYFKYPVVTIDLKESSTLSWKILGKVKQPGIYPLTEPITLRQALGKAGGLSTEGYEYKAQNSDLEVLADLKNSFILRGNKKLDIDFDQLIHSPAIHQDIFLKPGDYIYIAAYDYREIYVLGNLRAPAQLQYLDKMTLMQALASAGGWPIGGPYAADATNCIVIRGNLECPSVVRCDLLKILKGEAKDFYLVPGDIIYVHDKSLRFGRFLVHVAIETFINSFATAAGSYYAQFKWLHINLVDN